MRFMMMDAKSCLSVISICPVVYRGHADLFFEETGEVGVIVVSDL